MERETGCTFRPEDRSALSGLRTTKLAGSCPDDIRIVLFVQLFDTLVVSKVRIYMNKGIELGNAATERPGELSTLVAINAPAFIYIPFAADGRGLGRSECLLTVIQSTLWQWYSIQQ